MKTPEGYEKSEIKKYLKSIDCYFVSPASRGFGAAGVPDLIACINGTYWSIEVKREGKKPTTLQMQRLEATVNAQGMAAWGTAEKVIATIEGWRKRR